MDASACHFHFDITTKPQQATAYAIVYVGGRLGFRIVELQVRGFRRVSDFGVTTEARKQNMARRRLSFKPFGGVPCLQSQLGTGSVNVVVVAHLTRYPPHKKPTIMEMGQGKGRLNQHPLYLVQRYIVRTAIVELGGPGGRVVRHRRGPLQCPAVFQIGSDPGRSKGVVANRRLNFGRDGATAHHLEGISLGQRCVA